MPSGGKNGRVQSLRRMDSDETELPPIMGSTRARKKKRWFMRSELWVAAGAGLLLVAGLAISTDAHGGDTEARRKPRVFVPWGQGAPEPIKHHWRGRAARRTAQRAAAFTADMAVLDGKLRAAKVLPAHLSGLR